LKCVKKTNIGHNYVWTIKRVFALPVRGKKNPVTIIVMRGQARCPARVFIVASTAEHYKTRIPATAKHKLAQSAGEPIHQHTRTVNPCIAGIVKKCYNIHPSHNTLRGGHLPAPSFFHYFAYGNMRIIFRRFKGDLTPSNPWGLPLPLPPG